MKDQFKAAYKAARNCGWRGSNFAAYYLWAEAEKWDRTVNAAVFRTMANRKAFYSDSALAEEQQRLLAGAL